MSRWPTAKRVLGSAEEGLHELHIAARKQVVNMRARLAQVRWALVLKTAVLLYLVTLHPGSRGIFSPARFTRLRGAWIPLAPFRFPS